MPLHRSPLRRSVFDSRFERLKSTARPRTVAQRHKTRIAMPLHRSPLRRSVFKCQIAPQEHRTTDEVTGVAEQKTSPPPAGSPGRSASLAASLKYRSPPHRPRPARLARAKVWPRAANGSRSNRKPSIQASCANSTGFADSSNYFDLNAYNTYSNCVMGLCNRSRISETFPIERIGGRFRSKLGNSANRRSASVSQSAAHSSISCKWI